MYLRMYSLVLGAYPADFKAQFASEMLMVFEQRASQHRVHGELRFMTFLIKELGGLLSGALRERVGRDKVISAPPELALPSDVVGAEKYLKVVSGQLIAAIANHDFVNARYYDEQDRKVRALLADLRARSH